MKNGSLSNYSKHCLGKNLELLRNTKGWSREEMARQLQRMGASAVGQSVANWEKGKNYPNAAALEAYKEIFSEYEISSKAVFNVPLKKWEYAAFRQAFEEENENRLTRIQEERRKALISLSNALDLGVTAQEYTDTEGKRKYLYRVGADYGTPPRYVERSCTPEELDNLIDSIEISIRSATRLFVSMKARRKTEKQI